MNDFSELPKWLRPKEGDKSPELSVAVKLLALLFAGVFLLFFLVFFLGNESLLSAFMNTFFVSLIVMINFANFSQWRLKKEIFCMVGFFFMLTLSICFILAMIIYMPEW